MFVRLPVYLCVSITFEPAANLSQWEKGVSDKILQA